MQSTKERKSNEMLTPATEESRLCPLIGGRTVCRKQLKILINKPFCIKNNKLIFLGSGGIVYLRWVL